MAAGVRIGGTDPLCTTDGSGGHRPEVVVTSLPAAGSAVTIADGADVTEGAIADAAATAGSTGTVSAKLRTISGSIGAQDASAATTDTGTFSLLAFVKRLLSKKLLNVGDAATVSSTAYEASHVLKNAAGTLVSLVGYNSKASAQFIQVYNSATVPADTAVPVVVFTVPATSNFSLDIALAGMPFTTGISVANSSTGPTKTIGSADCWFSAVVI